MSLKKYGATLFDLSLVKAVICTGEEGRFPFRIYWSMGGHIDITVQLAKMLLDDIDSEQEPYPEPITNLEARFEKLLLAAKALCADWGRNLYAASARQQVARFREVIEEVSSGTK